MPTGKRASMREGPLAALFRKTAEDTGQPGQPGSEPTAQTPSKQPSEPARRRAGGAHSIAAGSPGPAGSGAASAHTAGGARAPHPVSPGAVAPRLLGRHP